ncbi:hypothetical protein RKLH11_993 [Rhodobacteraceae bacterium KLH11]|nr:hypothetical protein RKLH11_993 [Rhodobacteraceae bacterium KLH11]
MVCRGFAPVRRRVRTERARADRPLPELAHLDHPVHNGVTRSLI